jgi:hypothetical protein
MNRMTFHTIRIHFLLAALGALFVSESVASSPGEGVPLCTNVTVHFADVETGRAMLTRRDAFIAAMSPRDRRERKQTDQEVSEEDFLAFVGRSVRPWTTEETNRIAGVVRTISDPLDRWQLPFPTNIWLIKTSGEEEFHSCYTRQNAIVFPAAEAAGRPAALRHVFLHELFHVLSRHNPELRKALYAIIGFQSVNEIKLPDDLWARKITNPDGIENGWRIGLTNRGEALQAVPVLLANRTPFNPFEAFRLLVVRPGEAGWTLQPVDGQPRLLKPSETTGWQEQIGRNTRYTIHPDEILADNFVSLIEGEKNLPTPRIVDGMAEALERAAKR